MKQIYLIQQRHPRLILFFAGWGADETLFKAYRPQHCDLMLCYDYRTLDFDRSVLDSYKEVYVIGWSMGVWAASEILPDLHLPIIGSTAINGTPFPIDEQRGIPPAIFRGTWEGLTGASLHKFLRRMCADSTAFKAFLQVTPRRPLDELKDELEAIMKYEADKCEAPSEPAFRWQNAIVGSADRIIPPANQVRAWQSSGTPVVETTDAHYQEEVFHHYLEELWTND